jgi:hypothetical protein
VARIEEGEIMVDHLEGVIHRSQNKPLASSTISLIREFEKETAARERDEWKGEKVPIYFPI